MRSNASSSCITRVVVDGQQEVELAELQLVMQRIQGVLHHLVPLAQRIYLGNALLDLAVHCMLRETDLEHDEPPARSGHRSYRHAFPNRGQ